MKLSSSISIPKKELKLEFTRAQGPGGQNVNKVETAVILRFDIKNSSVLPEALKARLLAMPDQRITEAGEIVIKANRHRTQERNKQDALSRLEAILKRATIVPKKRRKTKPSRAAKERSKVAKQHHSQKKSLRKKPI